MLFCIFIIRHADVRLVLGTSQVMEGAAASGQALLPSDVELAYNGNCLT